MQKRIPPNNAQSPGHDIPLPCTTLSKIDWIFYSNSCRLLLEFTGKTGNIVLVSIPLTDINDGDFQTKLCLLASVSTASTDYLLKCGYSALFIVYPSD